MSYDFGSFQNRSIKDSDAASQSRLSGVTFQIVMAPSNDFCRICYNLW